MIYVDKLRTCFIHPGWRWNKYCHLFADTLSELHKFAKSLRLKLSYFQGGEIYPHYDLTEYKRKEAVLKGAKEINSLRQISFVQLFNPKSKKYVKIDKRKGLIVSSKKTPYKDIPIR